MIDVLFEDKDILIFNKAPGVPLQGKGLDLMETHFIDHHIISRLDQPVSGGCILAKTKNAARLMSQMSQQNQIDKSYIAIVEGHLLQKEGVLQHKLIKKNGSKAYVDENNGKVANLKYTVVQRLDNYSVLEVEITTGRFHQIRAQLSAIEYSIKGDLKYGAKRSNKHPGIYLHCRKIVFVHPISKEKIKILANFPPYGLWNVINPEI